MVNLHIIRSVQCNTWHFWVSPVAWESKQAFFRIMVELFLPSREAEIVVERDLKESSVFATCSLISGSLPQDVWFCWRLVQHVYSWTSHLDKRLDETLSLDPASTREVRPTGELSQLWTDTLVKCCTLKRYVEQRWGYTPERCLTLIGGCARTCMNCCASWVNSKICTYEWQQDRNRR